MPKYTPMNLTIPCQSLGILVPVVSVGIQSVKVEDDFREVQINSLQLLSEKEYSELVISDSELRW